MSFEDDFVLPPRYTPRPANRTTTSRSSSASSSTSGHAKLELSPSQNPYLKTRLLPIEEYAEELQTGGAERLSVEERVRLYGSEIVPIPVPLEPREKEATHEKRFRGWLAKRRIDVEKQTVAAERKLRMEFARWKTQRYDGGRLFNKTTEARGAKRGRAQYQEDEYDDEDKDEEKGSDQHYSDDYDDREQEDYDEDQEEAIEPKRQRTEAPADRSDLLLRKRVVSVDAFRVELEREQVHKLTAAKKMKLYGTSVAPIPVPLFPGETIDDYERGFAEFVKTANIDPSRFATQPNKERSVRMNFARFRVKESVPELAPAKSTILERVGGSRTVDVVVKAEPKVERPTHTANPLAQTNAPANPTPFHTQCSLMPPPTASSTATLLRAFLACGCQKCMRQCMHRLVDNLEAQERATATAEANHVLSTLNPVMDITRDGDVPSQNATKGIDVAKMVQLTSLMQSRRKRQSATSNFSKSTGTAASEDPIEQQLQAQYDDLNARVGDNQLALSTITNQLQETPVDRVDLAASLQTDKQDLETAIEEEMDHRNAALAMLVVYMWRNDTADLTQRLQSARTTNVPHVQRVCHQKCASMARDLTRKRTEAEELKHELDDVLLAEPSSDSGDSDRFAALQRIGEQLTQAEQAITALHTARRREIATLIHFDAHVRELVETLLHEH